MPRDQIHRNPSIIEDAWIGCGTCVTGCSRLDYRFDFQREKPVVVDPLNCIARVDDVEEIVSDDVPWLESAGFAHRIADPVFPSRIRMPSSALSYRRR